MTVNFVNVKLLSIFDPEEDIIRSHIPTYGDCKGEGMPRLK